MWGWLMGHGLGALLTTTIAAAPPAAPASADSAAPSTDDPSAEAKASAAERAADVAFRNGEYAKAKRHVSKANRLLPRAGHLWMLAEIERYQGNCTGALVLYREYYASLVDPTESVRARVATSMEACGGRLPPAAAEPATPSAPAPVAAVAEPPEPVPRPADTPRRGKSVDIGSIALLATGGALCAGGGALFGVGVHRGGRASDAAADEMDFLRDRDQARAMRVAGLSVLAAGAAVAIVGVVRWAVRARRRRDSTARVLPRLHGG